MRNFGSRVKFRIRKFPGDSQIGGAMKGNREPMLDTVLRRLNQVKGEWPRIADESTVPYQTITKIACGFVRDPRVSTVQALYDYFVDLPEPDVGTIGRVQETLRGPH